MASSLLHTIVKLLQLIFAGITLGFSLTLMKTTRDLAHRQVLSWTEIALLLAAPATLVGLSLYLIIGYALKNVKPTLQEVFVNFLILLMLVGTAGVTMNLVIYPCWDLYQQEPHRSSRLQNSEVPRNVGSGFYAEPIAYLVPTPQPTERVCITSDENKFAIIVCISSILTMLVIIVDAFVVCLSTNTSDFTPKRNKRLSQGAQTERRFEEAEEGTDPMNADDMDNYRR